MSWIGVTYLVRSDARAIEARALDIAVEQSVEMPVAAITDKHVLSDIVGKVEAIEDRGGGVFAVSIKLAAATAGEDAGQLLNMLFGNTSLHDDVVLHDVALPDDLLKHYSGPNAGLAGLRRQVGAEGRALTCSALKPQGLPASELAALAGRLARGGIDFIKDDHGLADQRYSPFVARVEACAEAAREASRAAGHITCYVPSLSGHLDQLHSQMAVVRGAGVTTVMVSPMIAGVSNVCALVRENPDIAFLFHPTLAGSRIAPPLMAKLFRLLGADGVIFPSFGGRFGYSPETCRQLADEALRPWHKFAPAVPVPAGGMTLERVPELLDFYGRDVMLLIGGSLLSARERLIEETAHFTKAVAGHK